MMTQVGAGAPQRMQMVVDPAKQMAFQLVYQHLKSKVDQIQLQPMDWRANLTIQERARTIVEIATSLRLVRTDVGQTQAIQISTTFEESVYKSAISKDDYSNQCREKLRLIQESRQRQMAQAEGRMRSGQMPTQQQHPGQPGMGYLQNQNQQLGGMPQQGPQMGMQGIPPPLQQQRQQQLQQLANQQRPQSQPQMGGQFAQQAMQSQPPMQPQQRPVSQTQQLSPQHQQFLQNTIHAWTQRVGPAQIAQLNANPPPELRAMSQKIGIQPAQLYIRNQAMNMLKQKVALDMQQGRAQQMSPHQPLIPQPQQQQQQQPSQQGGQRPVPSPVPQMQGQRPPGMQQGLGQATNFGDMMPSALPYQDQAERAKHLADGGVEVVPASNQPVPTGFSPAQQRQMEQQRNARMVQDARVTEARIHASKFQNNSSPQQPFATINQPMPRAPVAMNQQFSQQQNMPQNRPQPPVGVPQQGVPPQQSQISPEVLANLPENIRNLPPVRQKQIVMKIMLDRKRIAAAANQQRPPSMTQPTPPQPSPATPAPTPQGMPPNAGPQQRPGAPNQLQLKPEHLAVLDQREVDQRIMGALGAQLPPELKTWGQMKEWALRQGLHQLHEQLKTRQAQWAYHQKLQLWSQMQQRRGLQGGSASPDQIGQPPAAGQQVSGPKGPIQGQQPQTPQVPQIANITDQQLAGMNRLHQEGRLNAQQQQLFHAAIHWRKKQQQQLTNMGQRPPQQQPNAPMQIVGAPPQSRPTPAQGSGASPVLDAPAGAKPVPQINKAPQMQNLAVPAPQSGTQNQRPPQAPMRQQPNLNMPNQAPRPPVPAPQQPPPQLQQPGAGPKIDVEMNPEKQELILQNLQRLIEEERRNLQQRAPSDVSPEEKGQVRNHLMNNDTKQLVRRINSLLPMFVLMKGSLKNALDLARAQNLLASQYHQNGEPKENITLSQKELVECQSSVSRYFSFVKKVMQEMHKQDPVKARLFQETLTKHNQRHQQRQSMAQQQQAATLAQAQTQQPHPTAPSQLSLQNLQKHTDQVTKEHRSSLAQKTRMSPDGSPPMIIKPSISVNDLKLPEGRLKRPRPPGPNDAPNTKSPKLNHHQSPAQTTGSSPLVKPSPPEKTYKCEIEGCGKAFAIKLELAEHQRWHEKEAERKKEEEGRQKWKVENSLDFALASVSSKLGLNKDGTPKDGTATKKPHATTTGATPMRSAMTPSAKSPVVSKSAPNAKEQVLTPPTTFWDTPGSPSAIRQCFEGIDQHIGGLNSLDASLFTPAYTPEETEAAEELSQAALASYEEWNPFGFKDVAGAGMLQDIDWDAVPGVLDPGNKGFAEREGFTLFVH